MPSIDVIIETTPVYITVTPQTNPNIQVKFGAVDSVNGETGVVLINAVPNGGTTGQVLAKNSNTDNDTGWINVSAGGVQTLTGTTNRISIDNTDPANPIANIAAAYDTAVTNAIAAAVSGKEDVANKQTDLTPSATKYPTIDAVNAGLALKLPAIPIISNLWRGAFGVGNINSGTWVAGACWFVPYFVEEAHSVTAIRAHVTVGVAGGSIRLALYDTSGSAYEPTTLLDESGTLAATGAAILSYTFLSPKSLTKGLYWMAIQVSTSATLAIRDYRSGIMALFPQALGAPFSGVRTSQPYGAFPNPASSYTYIIGSAGNAPIIEMLVQ